MDQPVFANVEIPRPGMASPLVRQTLGKVILELAVINEVGELLVRRVHNLIVNLFLIRT